MMIHMYKVVYICLIHPGYPLLGTTWLFWLDFHDDRYHEFNIYIYIIYIDSRAMCNQWYT